ncbi:hypothetical protein [Herbaspirillum sp. BH-1]|uniref:hypothetical protein n=1 Tax=Herbaspirillum sp. (strain BH-1) TaxID=2058884 RepID=UPI000C887E75|nr:hypothetical protein [Herbaspirillum sp. BH-1]
MTAYEEVEGVALDVINLFVRKELKERYGAGLPYDRDTKMDDIGLNFYIRRNMAEETANRMQALCEEREKRWYGTGRGQVAACVTIGAYVDLCSRQSQIFPS